MKKCLKKIITIGTISAIEIMTLSFTAFANTNAQATTYQITPERQAEAQAEIDSMDLKERLKSMEWNKAESRSEYMMLKDLEQQSESRLRDSGYTDEEIHTIQNFRSVISDKVDELSNIEEEQLRSMHYTEDQIYAIKNFDGSEEMMQRATGTLEGGLNIDYCRYDSSSNRTSAAIFFGWSWEGVPLVKLTDMMTTGWDGWVVAGEEGFVQYNHIYDDSDYIDATPTYITADNGEAYGAGYKFRATIENNYYYAQNGYSMFIVDCAGVKDMFTKAAYAHQQIGVDPSFEVAIGGSGIKPVITLKFKGTYAKTEFSESLRVKQ